MILINAAQVEWLVINQPETEHCFKEPEKTETRIDRGFWQVDIQLAQCNVYEYYLTPETYNQLPTEFKQLRDE